MKRSRHRRPLPDRQPPGRSDCRSAVPAADRLAAAAPRETRARIGTVPLLAVCGLLLLAVGLVFGQAVVYSFVNWDDPLCVWENPHVQQGLTLQSLAWAFGDRYAGSWVPLTWISHILDWQVYGGRGGGHHLTNLLLHAATAVVLFLTLARMTGRFWPSALVAALFAVHPLRAESVAWVTERKDVLSGLFYALTLLAYVGYVHRPTSWLRYLAVIGAFAMGLMAKPSLVALPFVLLLLDYWPLGRMRGTKPRSSIAPLGATTGRGFVPGAAARSSIAPPGATTGRGFVPARLLLEKLPLLALSAASSVVTMWAQETALDINDYYPVIWRIGNAFVSYLTYLGHLFYPLNLCPVYVRLPRDFKDFPLQQAIIACVALLAVTLLAWFWRRTRPYFLVGWLWYLGTMLPAIGLVQFGVQSVADRFTYFTQIGLAMALVWAAADATGALSGGRGPRSGRTRLVAALLSVPVLAALAVGGWRQTSCWSDSVTLWTRALTCDNSYKVVVHTSLGDAYAAQARWVEAIAEYDEALRRYPDCVEAAANRGVALRHLGRFHDAIGQYQRAIAIKDTPETRYLLAAALVHQRRFPEAVQQYQRSLALKDDPKARIELASLLAEMGRTAEAVAHYEAALRLKPDEAGTHTLLGSLLARLEREAEAAGHFREAIRLDPRCAPAHYELAEVLQHAGIAASNATLLTEAIEHYRAALQTNPNDVLARTNLGVTLMLMHQPAEAIQQCQRALAVRPDWAEAHNCLAVSYAQTGRFPEALAAAKTALRFAEKQQKKDLVEHLHSLIPLYQAGKVPH